MKTFLLKTFLLLLFWNVFPVKIIFAAEDFPANAIVNEVNVPPPVLKECGIIRAKECPLDRCQLITDCGGKSVCHDLVVSGPQQCGGLASIGDQTACCEGLVKRCGLEFFDGTCDVNSSKSNNLFPMCIPCGNGICNQFENRCNCPEDCR